MREMAETMSLLKKSGLFLIIFSTLIYTLFQNIVFAASEECYSFIEWVEADYPDSSYFEGTEQALFVNPYRYNFTYIQYYVKTDTASERILAVEIRSYETEELAQERWDELPMISGYPTWWERETTTESEYTYSIGYDPDPDEGHSIITVDVLYNYNVITIRAASDPAHCHNTDTYCELEPFLSNISAEYWSVAMEAMDIIDSKCGDVALPLSAYPMSVDLVIGDTGSFSVQGGVAPYTVTSFDELVIDVDENADGNRISVIGIAPGRTTITVRDSTGALVEVTVSVASSSFDPSSGELVIGDMMLSGWVDNNHYEVRATFVSVSELFAQMQAVLDDNPETTGEQLAELIGGELGMFKVTDLRFSELSGLQITSSIIDPDSGEMVIEDIMVIGTEDTDRYEASATLIDLPWLVNIYSYYAPLEFTDDEMADILYLNVELGLFKITEVWWLVASLEDNQ